MVGMLERKARAVEQSKGGMVRRVGGDRTTLIRGWLGTCEMGKRGTQVRLNGGNGKGYANGSGGISGKRGAMERGAQGRCSKGGGAKRGMGRGMSGKRGTMGSIGRSGRGSGIGAHGGHWRA